MILRTAGQADLLKTSLEDVALLFGMTDLEVISRRLLDLGAKAVVITLGANGAHLSTPSHSEVILPCKVDALDATGAGDAFTGALLAELSRGRTISQAARFANVAAALSTRGFGAVEPLPKRQDVEAMMKAFDLT